jgi:hypothetical protein
VLLKEGKVMRFFIGIFLSSVAMFFWGFLFWTILPFGASAIRDLPNYDQVVPVLKSSITESGVYVIPGAPPSPDSAAEVIEEHTRRHEAGPIATLMYRTEGVTPMAPSFFIRGFLHFVAVAWLAAMLTTMALPALPEFGTRVGFVFMLGILAFVWIDLSGPVWWYHPWHWALMNGLFHVVSALLMGIILALFITSPSGEVGD